VGHVVAAVLLPWSQPLQEVCVQGLGGGVERLPVALASHDGVLGGLLVGGGVGVRIGPVLRVVDVVRIRRLALVREEVRGVLVDFLPTVRLRLH